MKAVKKQAPANIQAGGKKKVNIICDLGGRGREERRRTLKD